MYKKINQGKDRKNFKSKRIILGGVSYEVNDQDELDKIRRDLEERKKLELEVVEEEKTKKILVKKIHAKNMDVQTIKIISDIPPNQTINKSVKPQIKISEPAKPKLIVKKPTSFKQTSKFDNRINTLETPDVSTLTNTAVVAIPSQTDKKPLGLKIHERKSINKIKNISVKSETTNVLPNDQSGNEQPSQIINNVDNKIDTSRVLTQENVEGYYNKQFEVQKSQWYVLVLKISTDEQGLLKILEGKVSIFPLLMIMKGLFLYKKYNNFDEYRIYFKSTLTSKSIDVYLLGVTVNDIKLQQVTFDVVQKSVDLWNLRKMFDLELIKYYVTHTKFDYPDKFFDKFNSDYELFKDPNYFDKYLKMIKIDTKNIIDDENDSGKINVMYLMHSSIEYENNGYTLRTHNLIKHIGSEKYDVFAVTRFGYPFDKDFGNSDSLVAGDYEYDGIKYIKLLSGTDNYNNNNIIEYIKKYIVAIIKFAIKRNIKIIHTTSNYWNGIAALYASKYLGIKAIYELRGLWDEGIITSRPEVRNSDMLKMMKAQENKIYNDVNKIVVTNKIIADKMILEGVNETKISIIQNGVDSQLLSPDKQIGLELREKHNIGDNTVIIGYIGSLVGYEGLSNLFKIVPKLHLEKNIKIVIIGDGPYKKEMEQNIKTLEIETSVIYLGKMDYLDAIKYYNMFDLVVYPRKKCDLCNSLTSYKIFEAMSMELPIIIPNFDAFDGIIIDGESGLTFEADNIDDMTDKIKLLVLDHDLRLKLGKNAREFVIKTGSWQTIGDNVRGIYDDLLMST